ncbi:3-hydroxyisobutyrate dehydrogenase [Deinococcus indicus]|uniref:3-hydroxyisobutyrate dehydrogenase n=1 Tax=Deinococcus indicus TaxID=223556 RepID=A0A246BQ91_9DEIO|nr:NAD(P)-dependent oxidoreductase [Deinococcus indicus]OWL97857.1 3-hydroxyisobutyrate dehydrogenase [Deinococcus indicus]GHG36110.1 3-hydroxyisobutyrate dehydrogenase [Deinococcus indicus]
MTTLAFLGLGAMGDPMAAHVTRHARQGGHRAQVWNRTASRAHAHAQAHGSEVASLEQAAQADVIFTCLPTSAQVDEVLTVMEAHLKAGAVWVDCTSGHPQAAAAQGQRLAARGVTLLDAPVSGGTGGAQAGTLTVMVGGPADALEAVRPHLAFAGKVVHVGQGGAGFAVKAVNNALLGAALWATGEGLAVLSRVGVDLHAALDVINASSGRSNASQNLIGQRVLTREFPATFALGLLAKDAGIAADLTGSVQGSAPLLAQTAALLRAAEHLIGADEDHTAALKLIEQMNRTELN